MTAMVVGLQGGQAGKQFAVGSRSITFGRGKENDIVLATGSASRVHAELRREAAGYVLYDKGSTNGTWVNGASVTVRPLKSGDQIVIGNEIFRFDAPDARAAVQPAPVPKERVLRVTVTGGGPVGLSFALLLEHLMGARVAVRLYDSRWLRDGDRIIWKGPEHATSAASRS